jgi:hypothetical protein
MNKSVLYGVLAVVVLALLAWGAVKYSDRSDVDTTPTEDVADNSQTSGGCFIGGCSNQICSDQEGAVSTCEFREEYSCYQTAKCERQADGECGWTQSSELMACLAAKTDIQVELGK